MLPKREFVDVHVNVAFSPAMIGEGLIVKLSIVGAPMFHFTITNPFPKLDVPVLLVKEQ